MSATIGKTPAGLPVAIDVDRLVASRLLVQANSGAGKSWALRRLIEQTHGQVQQIILDVEGEFYTLREKHDFILARAGERDRDCPAEPRGAAILGRKLLELGVSAVVDIYELKAQERLRFARLFLDAIVNAPRELWHPCLVIIDEAHIFCPQKGDAESAGSVIDLMTRGRKRGFCGIPATQRLSKLHKDAAAECNNKLIGRTSLDVDMDRAGDELGFSKAERTRLRALEPGHFFAFGPALTSTVTEVVVGPVATTHPKPGQRATQAPPPRAKVQKVLGQLADLPREAEEEARTLGESKARVKELERELAAARAAAPKPPPAPAPVRVEVPILTDKQVAALTKSTDRLADAMRCAGEIAETIRKTVAERVKAQTPQLPLPLKPPVPGTAPAAVHARRMTAAEIEQEMRTYSAAHDAGHVHAVPARMTGSSPPSMSPVSPRLAAELTGAGVEQRMLAALAQFGELTPRKLAMIAGVKRGGSTWRGGMAKLRAKGLIEEDPGVAFRLSEGGRGAAPQVDPLPEGEALIGWWRGRFGGATLRAFDAIVSAHPGELSAGDLAEAIDAEKGGSTMRGALAALRKYELIAPRGLRAADELFS